MSKAVLVLDEMPETCPRCWLVQMELHDAKVSPYCGVAEGPFGGWRTIDVKAGDRPDWCPLREFPQHKETDNMVAIMHDAELANRSTLRQMGYNKGWNDCLDGLGGSNGRN